MNSNKRKRIYIFTICMVAAFGIVRSQSISSYLDVSYKKTYAPPAHIQASLNTLTTPVNITYFTSKDFRREFNLSHLNRWIQGLSPKINTRFVDPFKSPDIADHYDISTDGMIVIEHKDHRFDIDIIEQLLTNEHHVIERLQQHMAQTILRFSATDFPRAVIIHSSTESLLNNTSHVGLSKLNDLFKHQLIDIAEQTTTDQLSNLVDYDLIILYKLSALSVENGMALLHSILPDTHLIMFNHPKFSGLSNRLNIMTDISFTPHIIEDKIHSLMHADNQLLIQYTSQFLSQRTGVFPYSGGLKLHIPSHNYTLTQSSHDSFILDNDRIIKQAFVVMAQNDYRTILNNYLIPTNYWIQQGDNHAIMNDIILHHTAPDTLSMAPNTQDPGILLTWGLIVKLLAWLLILPSVVYKVIPKIILNK